MAFKHVSYTHYEAAMIVQGFAFASKERKIGDLEPESGFAASAILNDRFLSPCLAPRKSQLSGHPEKPRPILLQLVPFL